MTDTPDTLVEPVRLAGSPGATPRRRRGVPRWVMFWRSPAGQPAWARPALLAIAAVATVLYSWHITTSGYATFYSVAVKSMSVSWKAFFYGALDPAATVTIDKLAGSFVPQALAARLFGYHQWSLTLPQVIEGVIAVLAMYRIGRRWLGPAAGLLAAGVFTATPVLASMFGHPMEDGMLTMCLVLAADAFQRALSQARLRSLIWAGVWVGIGFQAKMLQAWIILPALAVTYLLAAPTPLRRRLAHLGAAGAVMLAVSLSWVGLYTLTPAQDRPYVDGSTNNSAVAMVFGYNGLDRFGIHVPGAVTSGPGVGAKPSGGLSTGDGTGSGVEGAPGSGGARGADGLPGTGGPGGASGATGALPGPGGAAPPQGGGGFPPGSGAGNGTGSGGGPQTLQRGGPGGADGGGWSTLLGSRYAGQIAWLYPLAVLGLAWALIRHRRAPRTDPTRSGFLLWGLWLATVAVVFSNMTIPHTAYLASLAPPLAALGAGGIVLAWRALRDGSARWLLPALVAAQLAWVGYLSRRYYSAFLPWLVWLAIGVGLAGVALLLLARLTTRRRRVGIAAGAALGVAAMLLVPAGWSGSVLDPAYAGSAFDAAAGPSGATLGAPAGGLRGSGPDGGDPGGGGAGAPGMTATDTLSTSQRRIVDYLVAHRNGASYLAATDSWNSAGPYIQATGEEFLPMGGFSGSVPNPTLAQIQNLIANGTLRYFLLSTDGRGGGFGGRGGSAVSSVTSWVESSCTQVPAGDYGADDQSGGPTLYRCDSS